MCSSIYELPISKPRFYPIYVKTKEFFISTSGFLGCLFGFRAALYTTEYLALIGKVLVF